MLFRAFQILSLIASLAIARAGAAELRPGNSYQLTFTDVDQRQLSVSDGHVTIITVATRENEQKAQAVGDSVPRSFVGNPKYRLITLVNFQQKIFPAFRGMISALIRHRLEAEGKDLQATYTARHIARDARRDIYVVADFDGKAVAQLGIGPTSAEFAVFVFDGRGRLIKRWSEVPSAEALNSALNEGL